MKLDIEMTKFGKYTPAFGVYMPAFSVYEIDPSSKLSFSYLRLKPDTILISKSELRRTLIGGGIKPNGPLRMTQP